MPNCVTNCVTISTCPKEYNCDACKEVISAKCIIYHGTEFPELGITDGKTLEEIIELIGIQLSPLTD